MLPSFITHLVIYTKYMQKSMILDLKHYLILCFNDIIVKRGVYILKLKDRKDKLINNIKQEAFRKELETAEYACYTSEQKRDIMRFIKNTKWDLPRIRSIFQNNKIKQNIDKLIYIFKIMENDNKILKSFCWDIICEILNNINDDVDFNLAIDILQEFVKNDVSEVKYYRASELLERFIINDGKLSHETKLDLFKSVLVSTDNGLRVGKMLFFLISICDFKNFSLVNETYRGVFDESPEICEMISRYTLDVENALKYSILFDGTIQEFWEVDENAKILNEVKTFINGLEEETIRIKNEEKTSPTGPKM